MLYRRNKLLALFFATALSAALVSYWYLTVGTPNLAGVCPALGRPVTKEEIHQKWIDYLNADIAANNMRPSRSSFAWRMINAEIYNKGGESEYDIKVLPKFGPASPALYIFPDVPNYALEPNGVYSAYNGGVDWAPVPFWERVTGYAFNLVFLDVVFNATTYNGKKFSQRIDTRNWVNSCGEIVQLPKKYDIG